MHHAPEDTRHLDLLYIWERILKDIQSKAFSAITVQVNRLTSEQYEADDMSGIPDLIEVIRIQAGGPTEAARAIRKKLYSN